MTSSNLRRMNNSVSQSQSRHEILRLAQAWAALVIFFTASTGQAVAAPESSDTASLLDRNKATVRKVLEMFNQRDLSAVKELFTENHVNHSTVTLVNKSIPNVLSAPPGREPVMTLVRTLESSFSDFRFEILDLVAEGDRVVFRIRFSGTHDGTYMEIPATGNNVSFESIHIARIVDGKVAEHWSVRDDVARLRQFGFFDTRGPNSKKQSEERSGPMMIPLLSSPGRRISDWTE